MLSVLAAALLSCADAGACVPHPATTNHVRSSQDLSSGWSAASSVPYNTCTITSDVGMAPTCAESDNAPGCGLQTADRVQCPSVANGEATHVYQSNACPSGPHAGALFVRSPDAGSQSVNLYAGDVCVACEASGSWSRCIANNGTEGSTFAFGNIGSMSSGACSGAKAALDLQVWQADCQNSATITPPIVTGATALTRETGCVLGPVRKLAGMGDSIMLSSGTGLPAAPVRIAWALGPSYAWIQGGVSGDTCGDVRDRWASVKAEGATHLVIMCGVNDARTGRTAEQAWVDEEAVLADALDAGIKVRLVKTLNFDGATDSDSTKVARINTLRGYQQSWCTAHDIACADPAVALQSGDVLRFHQGDYLHPDSTGAAHFVTAITSWPQRYMEGW